MQFDAGTGMPTKAVTSTDAAVNVLWNKDNSVCPGKCVRPVGLAWDGKGRLWMVSDSTNEVWVIGGAS